MTERPILFSAPMVCAILAGEKTQTRRVVKPAPPTPEKYSGSVFGLSRCVADGVKMYSLNDHPRLPKHPTDWDLVGSVGVARNAGEPMRFRCPYGQPGDQLWVREAWAVQRHEPCEPHEREYQELLGPTVRYLADGATRKIQGDRATGAGVFRGRVESGRPSIHMPRWASRILLEITGVRVERLHAITPAAAEAEGVREASLGDLDVISPEFLGKLPRAAAPPLVLWEFLWKSINGDASWDANPFVWVVEFKRVQP